MKRSVQDILNKPYARVLIRNEDGTYTAQILEFPGCVAEGDTPDEAIDDLDKAASSWIEVAIQQNESVPEPLASYGYSGKINLRLPKSIHKQAARFAQRDDVSLNQFFASAIAARVGAEDFCDRLAKRLESRWMPYASTAMFQQNISCILFSADVSGLVRGATYISASSPWVMTQEPSIVPVPTITAEKKP